MVNESLKIVLKGSETKLRLNECIIINIQKRKSENNLDYIMK